MASAGLAPAIAVGVVAGPCFGATVADEVAADCKFNLDESGQPKLSDSPPSGYALQGFAPKVDGQGVTFDLVAGDTLEIAPVGPKHEFQGKRIVFDVEATIVREHKRNCKKIEERQPYAERGHERGPTLNLGDQVKLVVEVRYRRAPESPTLFATFDRPVEVSLHDSATVTVRLEYNRNEVEFAPRAVTLEEQRQYVDPEVARLQRERPTYRDIRSTNAHVEPGDLGTLAVSIHADRGR
jgi:hypothetical protein